MHRILTALSAIAVVLGVAFAAIAAGSSSSSTKPEGPYDRAVDAVKAGDYQQALPLLEKAVDQNPRDANAWNYLGFSHRNLKQYDKALAAYEKALSIDPKHKGALEYLGELYVQTGEIEKAQAQLEKLDDACGFFGCDEYDDLKKSIESYQSAKK